MESGLTRRQLLRAGAAAGASAGLAGLAADPVLQAALAAPTRKGKLKDIEHVVILMQENRSFDHYFGTFPGVRGFGDRHGSAAFTQPGFTKPGFNGVLMPFHLATGTTPQCFPDITHDWGPQHRAWDGGAMDHFVSEHIAVNGPDDGPATMGYYTQKDLPFYWALAQAFTLCDRYFCSVVGPTDPNRLYSMTGTIDPAGANGGPLVETLVARRALAAGTFTWPTMPEQLSAHGVSWKIYTGSPAGSLDNVMTYFKNFQTDPKLQTLGMKPTWPADFRSDLHAGKLPQVSWILTGVSETEHPGFSSSRVGEYAARQVVSALTSKKSVWDKSVLFVTWDENGGFFDHVAPPTAPPGTSGEYLTTATLPAAAQGIAGPIGLGFRVPMIVVSPFSRGGYVSSDVFDHTSMLRFLETRFGVEVPNLSAWRRSTTGDLTSAFSFKHSDPRGPRLPAVQLSSQQITSGGCATTVSPVTVPPNSLPKQQKGRPKRPTGLS